MKYISTEDIGKFIPPLCRVISTLGDGTKKAEIESEISVGDEVVIANVKGYWVEELMRIDIKFRS